jgi:hypothetical protein
MRSLEHDFCVINDDNSELVEQNGNFHSNISFKDVCCYGLFDFQNAVVTSKMFTIQYPEVLKELNCK